jgi:hypothetical protein
MRRRQRPTQPPEEKKFTPPEQRMWRRPRHTQSPKEHKFFGSFFQKRTASFPHTSFRNASAGGRAPMALIASAAALDPSTPAACRLSPLV